MIRITAKDLTFLGVCKEQQTERHMYTIPDQLGEALASPDKPHCDGFYVLVVIRVCGELISVRLHVEDQVHPMETVLIDGVDYDRANVDESEREAYAATCK